MTIGQDLIFDFDDTIIVSRADRANLLLEALASFGAPGSSESVARFWGQPFEELVAGVSPVAAERFEDFLHHYVEMLRSHIPRACQGASYVIPHLALQHRLFVHSSSHSLLVRTDLESLDLLSHFEFVCGSDWQPVPKPARESLTAIRDMIEGMGRTMENVWYIGDTTSDAAMAQGANLRFVAIAPTHHMADAFRAYQVPPNRIVHSLEELERVVS
jgi:phosphoglycolate phosphatase-like HAD superfamily hydrolase